MANNDGKRNNPDGLPSSAVPDPVPDWSEIVDAALAPDEVREARRLLSRNFARPACPTCGKDHPAHSHAGWHPDDGP